MVQPALQDEEFGVQVRPKIGRKRKSCFYVFGPETPDSLLKTAKPKRRPGRPTHDQMNFDNAARPSFAVAYPAADRATGQWLERCRAWSGEGWGALQRFDEQAEAIAPSQGRLERLRGRLAKSQSALGRSLLGLLGGGDLDEASWEEVEDTLLIADLGPVATTSVV